MAAGNTRKGQNMYEIPMHDIMHESEYTTIGTAGEEDARKHQDTWKETTKRNDKIEMQLANQAKHFKVLKLVSLVLAIAIVAASVTFGILIKELMRRIREQEHASVDGTWTAWSPWQSCSETCGKGTTTRQRECSNPSPQNGGKLCPGNHTASKQCFYMACPVNGGWSMWTNWSSCNSAVAWGLSKRQRACTNPSPSSLGRGCIGDSTDKRPCPVDGIWTAWSPWQSCSETCGKGTTTRQRECSNPSPQNGGKLCPGNHTDSKQCVSMACPVNGGWSMWTNWSSCNSAVAWGLSKRQRACTNPSPSSLGRGCIGDSTDKRPCPVDGIWTAWSPWQSCSETCGKGTTTRQRECSNPSPQNGGKLCPGNHTDSKQCVSMACPVNGGWSTWTSWSSCNSTVAWGLSQRQRACTNPSPSSLGRGCIGDSTDKRPCPGVMSAFTVYKAVAGLTPGTIRFTDTISNIGGHYSTYTGIFTCKYPGVYVFALHVMTDRQSTYAQCFIRKNGYNVVPAWIDPDNGARDGYYGSSNSVVLHLVYGDKVNVALSSPLANIHTSWRDTSFSGFLLKAD